MALATSSSTLNFNSTMVRLKELDVKRYGAMGRNFNSTMVRLKEPACSVQPNQHLFQFHYGTIKRNMHLKSVTSFSVFQFHYGGTSATRPSRSNAFQFHYGTIKSFGYRAGLCPGMAFQFHYGTIKSYRNDESVRYKTGIFQFHYGTIKRFVKDLEHINRWIFQFHYGTIKRQGECCYSWSNNYISIPLWYD